MQTLKPFLQQTSLSGTVSGLLMAAVIAGASRYRAGHTAQGLNAVSHMMWGRQAARQAHWSVRYTLPGVALNQLACVFWAGCLEAILDGRRTPLGEQARHATIISFVAYLVDYHVVPKRFTPGFELMFPGAWFPWLYAGLAGSLWAGAQFRTAHSSATSVHDDYRALGPG